MNRELGIAFFQLKLSQKNYIVQELGFGARHANEKETEYWRRFFSSVQNEGKVRALEALVLEQEKL